MFTAEYDILVRNRRTQLLREAEHERLLTEMKQQKTVQIATTSSRQWALWLGCSLVKWGRKLEQFGLPGNVSA